MSAPRPYETDPFHLQSSVHILYYDQFMFIFKRDPVVSSIWYFYCLGTHFSTYACGLPQPLFSSFNGNFEVISSSTWYVLVRIISVRNTRHFQN